MIARRGQRRLAFTLIEILVVVAIIALLVAILLPSLAKAREQGRQAVCGSNNRQIGIAMRIFAEEHKEYYPEMYRWFGWPIWYYNPDPDTFSSPLKGNGWEEGHILKYVGKQEKVFLCPSDDGSRRPRGPGEPQDFEPMPVGHGNYSMQKDLQRLAEAASKTGKPPFSGQYGDRDPMAHVWFKEGHLMGSPSRVMMIMEQGGVAPERGPFNDVTAKWSSSTFLDSIKNYQSDDLTDRHSKRGHLLFFDGHVDAILSEENFNGPSAPDAAKRLRAATKAGFYFDRLYSRSGVIYVRSKTHRSGDDDLFE